MPQTRSPACQPTNIEVGEDLIRLLAFSFWSSASRKPGRPRAFSCPGRSVLASERMFIGKGPEQSVASS